MVEKMIGYRVSFRAVSTGDKEVEEPLTSFTVRKETIETVIKGLQSYTRYEIRVAGFSRKEEGLAIVAFGGKK